MQQLNQDIQNAYLQARKHKRRTHNVQVFEGNLTENLETLYQDILHSTYQISPSIYFINEYPVKREIFAGTFRDRIIHHLVFEYIANIFEKQFIYDSYSCRKGKGTSLGVKRISKFIRACSENYTRDCWILKLDIQGYFMSIDKDLLYEKIKDGLNNAFGRHFYENTLGKRKLLEIIENIIYNDPTQNGIFKGKRSHYDGLPHSKSLFYAKLNCGLPIGNLTSQLFSNIYLNDFDHWIMDVIRDLSNKDSSSRSRKLSGRDSEGRKGNSGGQKAYYGRYVDDFVLIHPDKDYLLSLIPKIRNYLSENLHLELHPCKVYLQHYSKGVSFLGAIIKPYRLYPNKRVIGNFRKKLFEINQIFLSDRYNLDRNKKTHIVSVVNSYLGFLKHYKSFKIRKKMLTQILSGEFWEVFCVNPERTKIEIKPIVPNLPWE